MDKTSTQEITTDETTTTPQESRDLLSRTFGSVEAMVNRYNHCAICGSHLHFTHVTDFARNLTQETARCPECGIRTRQVSHRLQ